MTALFVCAGTAGHVNPAIAVAEELRSQYPDSKIIFIGANKAIEKKLVPQAGFELVNIEMTGLRRGFSPSDIIFNIKTAINLMKASAKSSKLLKEYNPDFVFGTGAYICYPVMKKASKRGIPTFILEPNAYPGLAVKMLDNAVDKIFVTYKGLENNFKHPKKVIHTGTPLQKNFFEADDSAEKSDGNKRLVVSFFGSLGASKINEMMIDFIKLNTSEASFRHIHASGISDGESKFKSKLTENGVTDVDSSITDIREYITDMPSVMNSADLIICRSGASTLAELTALGKPAILVPSPYVTDNHQEVNAKRLFDAGGAVMILEKECTGEILYKTAVSLLSNKNKLEQMSNAQKSLATMNSADNIVKLMVGYCNEKEGGSEK